MLILESIRAQIQTARQNALPKSSLAKACDYTLTLWNRLIRFLDHPVLLHLTRRCLLLSSPCPPAWPPALTLCKTGLNKRVRGEFMPRTTRYRPCRMYPFTMPWPPSNG